MSRYAIGDVEAFLGLPASTLRYWERAVPLLAPRKEANGRRSYSEADLRILLRLRHLVRDRGLSIAEAGEAFLAEREPASTGTEEVRARLAELRGELIGLWFDSDASGRRLSGGGR